MTNIREIAYDALLIVDKNEQSNDFIKDLLDKYSYLDKQDRSFLTRIIEGTIERTITIDYILNQYSKVKVPKMKPPVRTLLRMGVYQIMYMDKVPESAAVNETVKIAKKRGLYNLTGFMNGVLRTVARNKEAIDYPDENTNASEYLSVKYSCPAWIVKTLIDEQGLDNARCLLNSSVSVRPITTRVNISKIDNVNEISFETDKSGVAFEKSEILPYAYSLHNYDTVGEIRPIINGQMVVQDISSMLVCELAGIKETDVVIDCCASPGGKTMHAADIAKNGTVISCDISDDKVRRIEDNIKRAGFTNVQMKVLDATKRCDDLVGKADVLLVDVPCSGLGVMGRKNDIKYRLKEENLEGLVELQRHIISNVASYVKSGGIMMFSTCTVRKAENEDNYKYIIESGMFDPIDFSEEIPEKLYKDTVKDGFIQLYGEEGLTDGFFIAKFRKR